jgi:hypothetical protein
MTAETETVMADRVRESWFVTSPDTVEQVLLCTHPRANYAWLCSCGKHGTIASSNHAYAVDHCAAHLRLAHVDTAPADPFDGVA